MLKKKKCSASELVSAYVKRIEKSDKLRYGENPHQQASVYKINYKNDFIQGKTREIYFYFSGY